MTQSTESAGPWESAPRDPAVGHADAGATAPVPAAEESDAAPWPSAGSTAPGSTVGNATGDTAPQPLVPPAPTAEAPAATSEDAPAAPPYAPPAPDGTPAPPYAPPAPGASAASPYAPPSPETSAAAAATAPLEQTAPTAPIGQTATSSDAPAGAWGSPTPGVPTSAPPAPPSSDQSPWASPQPGAQPASYPPPPGSPAPTSQLPTPAPATWGSDVGGPSPYAPPTYADADTTAPQPAYAGAASSPYASPSYGTDPSGGGSFTPPPGGTTSRERRRPGWPGVIAVGVGAAVIASLLTAGLVDLQDSNGPGTASSSSTSTAPAASGPVTSSTAENPDWVKVAAAVEPSVVSIQVQSQSGSGGEGSGVILDSTGRILTNNHVVAEASSGGQMAVVLSDGRQFTASLVGNDPSTDLAVIKLESAPSGLTPITFGNSDDVKVGDPVMAVGNPLGLSGTVTTGIVSATDRPVTTSTQEQSQGQSQGQSSSDDTVVTNAIQTDAAVNPGNSGGALVDVQGRLLGVTSSIASLGSSYSGQSGSIGLGFAIPVNEARSVAQQLNDGKTVQHAWLGVSLTDDTVRVDGAERQAAVMQNVSAGSPAQKAGLEKGDAVIAVNDEIVNGSESLVAQIRERQPGAMVTLKIVRDGQARDVQVTLATKPAS